MFSGLRSMIFGYSEPSDSPDVSANNESSSLSSANKINDTSALLEQTLNAAATKFTEQLLPPSPSIEQLQSSSHQLLPTLNEQHEEDELKKRKQTEKVVEEANLDEDEDDECFNSDSWELLDLVEKSPVVSPNSVDGKASGILKSSHQIQTTSRRDDSTERNQKLKVSFETSISVDEKRGIEKTGSKQQTKGRKKSKAKKVAMPDGVSSIEIGEKVSKNCDALKNEVRVSAKGQTVVPIPTLNYAAAVSTKLKADASNVDKTNIGKPTSVSSESGPSILQLSGALKRNRPVSSSSWSSGDEIEAIDSVWDSIQCESSGEGDRGEVVEIGRACEDNESLISSNFSDCEFGYEGLNDFVMRPKKAQNKRRGLSSTSNPLLISQGKRGADRSADNNLVSDSPLGLEPKNARPVSSKNSRPKKKKKLVISHPSKSVDCSKKSSAALETKKDVSSPSKPFISQSDASSLSNSARSASHLMPPPPPSRGPLKLNVASSSSGNDSSDIAEMDESWYVTPPPCFTGSNKLDGISKPKAKEADRENALIEHPSIYIASTSKPVSSERENCRKRIGDSLVKQKAIVIKKVAKQSSPTYSGSEIGVQKKSPISATALAPKDKPKSWENKFIITNWNYEADQDDVNDFDNLFEVENYEPPKVTKKSKPKSKKQQQTKRTQTKSSRNESPSLHDLSAGYESDFSVSSPILVDITGNLCNESSNPTKPALCSDEEPQVAIENAFAPLERVNKLMVERKAPTHVRPIEPERQPGWQLKRKRSHRRRIGPSIAGTYKATGRDPVRQLPPKLDTVVVQGASSSKCGSSSSSARSTPTLIDRIGSSIVANLASLTSGFSPAAAQPLPRVALEEVEKLNQSIARKSNTTANLVARRQLSKGYLNRQNDCAKLGGSNRRADRRLKMHATPNGCSINRKVQTNFR